MSFKHKVAFHVPKRNCGKKRSFAPPSPESPGLVRSDVEKRARSLLLGVVSGLIAGVSGEVVELVGSTLSNPVASAG